MEFRRAELGGLTRQPLPLVLHFIFPSRRILVWITFSFWLNFCPASFVRCEGERKEGTWMVQFGTFKTDFSLARSCRTLPKTRGLYTPGYLKRGVRAGTHFSGLYFIPLSSPTLPDSNLFLCSCLWLSPTLTPSPSPSPSIFVVSRHDWVCTRVCVHVCVLFLFAQHPTGQQTYGSHKDTSFWIPLYWPPRRAWLVHSALILIFIKCLLCAKHYTYIFNMW